MATQKSISLLGARLAAGILRHSLRLLLLSGLSCASITAGIALGSPASAQTAATDGGAIENVTVTARKKAEDIQDVPLSVTALTAEDLTSAGVQDLRDITFLTPGLTFNEGAGANYFSKPIIRGQTDVGGSSDNNVPVFFDGVYISNSSAIDLGLVNLARVEVIKGPVSATYGRSAYAGAINYISAKPTESLAGFGEITGGIYGKFNGRGSISDTIIPGILTAGLSASYDQFDGTYHDSTTDQNANGYTKRDVLLTVDFTPMDHLEIRPVVYYGSDKFAAAATIYGQANCSAGAYSQTYCGQVPSGAPFIGPQIANDAQYGGTGNNRNVLMTNVQASLSYDWGTISSLTGYAHYGTAEYAEFDDSYGITAPTYYLPAGASVGGFGPAGTKTGATAVLPLLFGYSDKNTDTSEELRYTSPQNLPVRVSAGGYYASSIHNDLLRLAQETCNVPAGQYISQSGGQYFATPCGTNYSPQQTAYRTSNNIYAGFASVDWNILDNLILSGEIRDTENRARYTDFSAIFTPFPTGGYSTETGSSAYPIGAAPLAKNFWSLTSRSSLSYKPTENITAYVSAANGDKVGGFNNSIAYPTYRPETNWTYEAGIKTLLMNNTLQLNGDVFFIDSNNFQISGPPPNATLPGGFITTNYGGLTSKGVEASADYILDQNITLNGGFAYTDPEFKGSAYDFGDATLCTAVPGCTSRIQTVGPNKAVSLKGLTPPYVSNYTVNLAVLLRYPLMNTGWNWTGRLDYRYESSQFYQYPIDAGSLGAKNILNVRVGVENDIYSAVFYVRNLTNDKTPLTVQDASATGANNFQSGYFPVAVLPDGLNLGVTLRYKFGG